MRSLVFFTLAALCACSSSEDAAAPAPFVPSPPLGGGGSPPASPVPEAAPTGAGGPAPLAGAGAVDGAPGEGAVMPEGPLDGVTEAGGLAAPDAGPGAPAPPEPPPVTVSAGCGNANPPVGAGSLTIRGAQADYVITLPDGYSPDVPTPLVFGFHGRNQTHVQFQTQDASGIQTELGSRYIMVYPKSQGGPGWNFDTEVPPNLEFFDALYAQMTDNYCVDLSRVFAVGHSSGGYFSITLACRYGSLLRGIGSVAGAETPGDVCSDERVAGLFVHGPNDTVVNISGGRAARDELLARNGCQPATAGGVEPQCVAYQGCAEGFPVQWCEHAEPTYSDQNGPTNHGWPSFASQAVRGFFEALP